MGKTVAFVGRVDKVEDSTLFMTTEDLTQVKVIKFKGDAEKFPSGSVMEIRGIVNKDNSLSFGESTQYDAEFDLATYEHMLTYYHGMCKDLCVK